MPPAYGQLVKFPALHAYGPYDKSKVELKSNSSEILPSLSVFISFFFALKIRLKYLKLEFCQFKFKQNHG